MSKQHFTILDENGNPTHSHFVKNTPMQCARSYFKRVLRTFKGKEAVQYVIIRNIDTEKKYYYKCYANRYETPMYIPINKYKAIKSEFEVNILKLSEKFLNKN